MQVYVPAFVIMSNKNLLTKQRIKIADLYKKLNDKVDLPASVLVIDLALKSNRQYFKWFFNR